MPTFSSMNDLAKHLSKTIDRDVEFSKLFDSTFMNKYTDCSDIYYFLKNGGFDCENQQQLNQINTFQLNQYITSNTTFLTWDEMKQAALTMYIKKLGLK